MSKAPAARMIVGNRPPKVSPEMKEVEIPARSDRDYRNFAEQIAEHRVYEVGKFVPEIKAALPFPWRIWHVDKFFPYAKGGGLFVDEPKTQADFEESQKKKAVMTAAGFRMIILRSETSLVDARDQLDEVDHELADLRKRAKTSPAGRA